MKSIVYVSPFRRSEISGGIKVCFQHVEMLNALGFAASVFSPDGRPDWFHSFAPLFDHAAGGFDSRHIVVFPEPLDQPVLSKLVAAADGAAMKILFCQNQYYMLNGAAMNGALERMGFHRIITVSGIAQGLIARVFRPAALSVVRPHIDHDRFRPGAKEARIAVVPRKLPRLFSHIRHIFAAKYPDLSNVPWDVIENASEAKVAETFGCAAVFLSLCNLESFALTPLEAMASGAAVVGFHGYGGLEYATTENGRWFPNDHLEETADALALALHDFIAGHERHARTISSGLATARRFTREATMAALRETYAPLVAG